MPQFSLLSTTNGNLELQKGNVDVFTWFSLLSEKCNVQSWTFAYLQLLKKPYANGVTLREQNQPLKCCQPLESCYILKRGLYLSIHVIQDLQVKGLQSYQLSKLEFSRKSLPLRPFHPNYMQARSAQVRGRLGSNHFSKFNGWQLCSPLTYRPQIFSIKRSKTCYKVSQNFQRLAAY